jgi:uncharacterized protein YbbC (DUF1343 family)
MPPSSIAAGHAPVRGGPVRFGVDQLLDDRARWGRWRRVGLVTNEAARLAADVAVRSRAALLAAGVPVVRLFGPEHGLGGVAADGAAVADGLDPLTGVPVVSLYGARMRPARAQLADLDVVLFDIPDVGARFYTYAWTLWHLLHAAAEAGVPVVVLDRPNPLGGVLDAAEGPLLEDDCRSFVGESSIPVRHSLTLGELARLWQRESVPGVALSVVPCAGWDAARAWPAAGVPWVPTSPAMPAWESARWYPGTCLLEGTSVSVGRGTAAPFAQVGAPWLDGAGVAEAVRVELEAPEAGGLAERVRVTPTTFTPREGPYAGERCVGVSLALAPEDAGGTWVARVLRPVWLGLALAGAIADRHPGEFAWGRYPTAANPSGEDHLARLVGRRDVGARLVAVRGAERRAAMAEWTAVPGWGDRVAGVVLYGRG